MGSTGTETVADVALDQALVRISELTERLWAVQEAHRPGATGSWGRPPRCRGCHRAFPCPTSQVAAGAR